MIFVRNEGGVWSLIGGLGIRERGWCWQLTQPHAQVTNTCLQIITTRLNQPLEGYGSLAESESEWQAWCQVTIKLVRETVTLTSRNDIWWAPWSWTQSTFTTFCIAWCSLLSYISLMLLLSFKVTASCNWQSSSIPQKWTNQATNVFLHDTACSPLQAAVSCSWWRMLSWDHRDSEAEAGHWSVHHHQRAEHHVEEACYGDIGHSLQKRFLSLWQFVKPSNWEYLTSPVFTYKQIFGNKIFQLDSFPFTPGGVEVCLSPVSLWW